MNLKESIHKILKEYSLDEMGDELYHYIKNHPDDRFILSPEDIINFKDNLDQKITYKPKGLWYGIGTSWVDWVRSEMPEWEKDYNSVFLLEINKDRILQLGSKEELIEFTKKYSPSHNKNSTNKMGYWEKNLIDWSLVTNDYSGIEIKPYIYSARRDEFTNWYYPWDIASGCIWNRDGILSIKKVEL